MAKKIIWLVIIVAVIGGGFLFFKNSRQKNSGTQAVSKNVVVYADAGFSPNSLEIKVGDTVTFRNDSSSEMWVASAPHPTHTDLPEFDAKKVYNKGESYTFTFTKPGNWKFHNHLNPTQFGVIIAK